MDSEVGVAALSCGVNPERDAAGGELPDCLFGLVSIVLSMCSKMFMGS